MIHNAAAHGVPLVNTRTTFQRTRDARFFTGRIHKFVQNVLNVSCDQEYSLEPGDRFSFHVFGMGHEALFFATYRQECKATDPLQREYVFVLEGEINLKKTSQEPRFATEGLYADLEMPGITDFEGGKVIDISANGCCLLCPSHVRKGDKVKVAIRTTEDTIHGEAEVRYCIKDRNAAARYRIGLRLLSLDRISVIRWRNLYARVVHSSRYEAIRQHNRAA